MDVGIYSVTFHAAGQSGTGIVTIDEQGRVVGGDYGYLYTGILQEGSSTLQVHVQRHSSSAVSVFGNLAEFDLTLEGGVEGGHLTYAGKIAQAPGQQIRITGTRVRDLPIQD